MVLFALFFTAAALGLATPYLLIGVFPSLLRILPKPGKWMLYLQKIMGVLLLASVLWLLWIGFSAFGKMGFLFFSFIALLNLIFAFAIGKIAPPYKPFAREISAIAFVFVINFIIALLSPKFLEERSALIDNDWQAYSAKTLESMRLNGSIVFLDVTADWCITCKANEMAVIETKEIKTQIDERSIDVTQKTSVYEIAEKVENPVDIRIVLCYYICGGGWTLPLPDNIISAAGPHII